MVRGESMKIEICGLYEKPIGRTDKVTMLLDGDWVHVKCCREKFNSRCPKCACLTEGGKFR
jgi:hypothetical protein